MRSDDLYTGKPYDLERRVTAVAARALGDDHLAGLLGTHLRARYAERAARKLGDPKLRERFHHGSTRRQRHLPRLE
jgi:hypothetical protein